QVSNEYRVARLNFSFEAVPEMTIRFGGTYQKFKYGADQQRRSQSIEALNPTLAEAKLKITDLGSVYGFGDGLNLPAGTPTSFFAPELGKF
ncbi:hypothetical protein ABTM64_20315, partial [Acinetobacter baumannii]